MGPMKVFSVSGRAPRGLATSEGRLEREIATGELQSRPKDDEIKECGHLRLRHYLVKLLSALATATELQNREIVSGVRKLRIVNRRERGRA